MEDEKATYEELTYEQMLGALHGMLGTQVLVMIESHSVDEGQWSPAAVIVGELQKGLSTDLLPLAHNAFGRGEMTIFVVKMAEDEPAPATGTWFFVGRNDYHGGRRHPDGKLDFQAGCALFSITTTDQRVFYSGSTMRNPA